MKAPSLAKTEETRETDEAQEKATLEADLSAEKTGETTKEPEDVIEEIDECDEIKDDIERELCYVAKAVETGNEEYCRKDFYMRSSVDCWNYLGVLKNIPEWCMEWRESWCLDYLFLQNTELCPEISIDAARYDFACKRKEFTSYIDIEESCEELEADVDAKKACIMQIAMDTENVEFCEYVLDFTSDCKNELAIKLSDPEICSGDGKDECIETIAIKEEEVTICNNASDISDCVSIFSLAFNDSKWCETISAETEQKECLVKVASEANDPSLCRGNLECVIILARDENRPGFCESIADNSKWTCYFHIAILKDIPSICEEIKGSSLYSSCETYFEPDIATWKTHRNEEFGYEIRYPINGMLTKQVSGEEATDWLTDAEHLLYIDIQQIDLRLFVRDMNSRGCSGNSWYFSAIESGDSEIVEKDDIKFTKTIEPIPGMESGGTMISYFGIKEDKCFYIDFDVGYHKYLTPDIEKDLLDSKLSKMSDQMFSTFRFLE